MNDKTNKTTSMHAWRVKMDLLKLGLVKADAKYSEPDEEQDGMVEVRDDVHVQVERDGTAGVVTVDGNVFTFVGAFAPTAPRKALARCLRRVLDERGQL